MKQQHLVVINQCEHHVSLCFCEFYYCVVIQFKVLTRKVCTASARNFIDADENISRHDVSCDGLRRVIFYKVTLSGLKNPITRWCALENVRL